MRGLSPKFVIFLTIFIDMTGFGIIIPLLPYYLDVFLVGEAALGILVTSFAAMQFISSPILGRLSDKYGRRPVILFSILTSVGSFIIFAFANSFIMLLSSRIIAGLATEISVAQAYITDITDEKDRTKTMGRIGAANGVGMLIGPFIGGLLFVYGGFFAAGITASALALINLLFALLFLPETHIPSEWKKQPEIKLGRVKRLFSAFSKPGLRIVLFISFLMAFAFSAFPVIVPLLTKTVFGIGPLELAYFFFFAGLIQIIFQGFLIGKISNRLKEKKMIPLGSTLMAIGILSMGLSPNFAIFLIVATLMISGASIIGAAVPSFISKRIAMDERGSILGIAQSVQSTALIIGPTISGLIFERAGVVAPYVVSSIILVIATIFGIKIALSKR